MVSLRFEDTLVEMILKPDEQESRLVLCRDGESSEHASVSIEGRDYIPYSPENNLLTHRVILLLNDVARHQAEAQHHSALIDGDCAALAPA